MNLSKEYRLSVSDVIADLSPTYRRLVINGKIPNSVNVERITESTLKAVALLHEAIVPDSQCETYKRIRGTSTNVNYDLDLSRLLRLNDYVAGVALVYRLQACNEAFLYAVIVQPNMRKTWASVYLKYYSMLTLRDHSIAYVSFQALNDNSDTLRQVYRISSRKSH